MKLKDSDHNSQLKILTIFILFTFFLLKCYVVNASELSFVWTPPPEFQLKAIGGYYIYWGNESRNYVNRVRLGNVYETTVKELVEGKTYYFAVTSYNISDPDDESNFSDEAAVTIGIGQQSLVKIDADQPTSSTSEAIASVSSGSEPTIRNRQPIANAGTDQIETPGTMILLDGTSSRDPDGDILSYSWIQLGGPNVTIDNADSSQAGFLLPFESVKGQTFSFQLTVTDPEGLQSTDTCSVGVTVADMDVSGAWKSIDMSKQHGKITIYASFVLKNSGTEDVESVLIKFYESDDDNFDESDNIIAEHLVNNLPARATADIALKIENVSIGSEDRLIAVIDPEDELNESDEENNLSISSSSSIVNSANGKVLDNKRKRIGRQPSVKMDTDQPTSSTSEAIASVSSGSEPTIRNRQPVANAGTDQNETAGTMILLDGTSSQDPDGDILSYSWIQLGGPNVTIDNADSSQAGFLLPFESVKGQTFSFQLTVTDPEGLQSTDTCSVGVTVN